MNIKSIEFKNFGSYGNKLHKLEFNNEGGLYLIVGDNGSGKSTLLDIVKFSLYGKVQNKKVIDLVNRFNKNTYTKINFKGKNNENIVIERGLLPNYVKLYINNKIYDVAGKRNIDDYIENNIIEIPWNIFNNSISLSINDFKSFIDMTIKDKRNFINKIFNLEILEYIRILINNNIKENNNLISIKENEIKLLLEQLQSINDKIKNLELEKNKEINNNIIILKEKIKNVEEKILNLENNKKLLEEEYNILLNEINKLEKINISYLNELKIINEKEKLYTEYKKCPLCLSDLNTDFHKELLNNYKTNKNNLIKNIKENENIIIEKKKLANIHKEKINNIIKEEKEYLIKKTNYLKELENLTNNENNEIKILHNIFNENNKKLDSLLKIKEKLIKKEKYLSILEDIFKENGKLRQIIMNNFIPTFNNEVKKYLNLLKINYNVIFDNNFDPKIKYLGYDVYPSQLSTGERKKIDFAILLAIIKTIKIKLPSINILFLDEIFSSIDQDGINSMLYILKDLSKELKINTFVINHSLLPEEIFDYKINVKKVNNFSSYEILKIS